MLTDTACRNAKCPEGRSFIRLADAGGLYLKVRPPGPKSPAGSKLWRWKYRHAGKEKRLALGTYPAVSLADVRREHAGLISLDASLGGQHPERTDEQQGKTDVQR